VLGPSATPRRPGRSVAGFKARTEAPPRVAFGNRPRTGWAFAPGHLTGIFSPALAARDPRARGSVGAGLVLEAGVLARAEWRPARRPSLRLRSDAERPLPISEEVARRLLTRRPGALQVTLDHELPIGQGFGMSAAGALATALAVATVTGSSRRHTIEVAHLADLYGGGGLGGVSAILAGGLEVRERPGIPPLGSVKHHPVRGTVFIGVLGEAMPSPELLGDPRFLARVERAAMPGLERLHRQASLGRFLEEAERFTDSIQLGPRSVLRQIHGLRTESTRVAQTMFGRSLFAVAETPKARTQLVRRLTRLGIRSAEIPVARRGARVVPGPRRSRARFTVAPG
jgi:pantoate kinase